MKSIVAAIASNIKRRAGRSPQWSAYQSTDPAPNPTSPKPPRRGTVGSNFLQAKIKAKWFKP